MAKDTALGVASFFYKLAEFHIVEHFELQRFVCPDALIHASTDQIERSDTHVIFALRIGHLPRAMSENKQRLEKGNHHSFTRTMHDHERKQDNMVSMLCFGIGKSTSKGVGTEEHIGIGEQKPFASRLISARPHGMHLSHPALRQFIDMNDLKAFHRLYPGGNMLHDLACAVRRAVVDRDDF